MHYLLNQYDKWKKDGVSLFVVDYPAIFQNRYPSWLRDADNPERALEFCYDKDAKEHSLPNFGNVLAEFFNIEDDNEFEGYMIRNIFEARGIDVPSDVPNSWYGENFNFVPHNSGICMKIIFDNDNNSYLPTWILDEDGDDYHAKGTTPVEGATGPVGWVQKISKGEDCDDTVHADINNNDCSSSCKKRIGYLLDSNFKGKTVTVGDNITIKRDNFRNDDWGIISETNCKTGKVPIGSSVKVTSTTAVTRPGTSLKYFKVEYDECKEDNKHLMDCNDCGNIKKVIKDVVVSKLKKTPNSEILDALNKVLNKYGDKLGIDTSSEINHLLSQAAHESGGFRSLTEGTTYSIKGAKSLYGKFFSETDSKKDKMSSLGTKDCTSGGKPAKCIKDEENFFNIIYDDKIRKERAGWSGIGNDKVGDGWKYRGRGIFQLRGRENYTKFSDWYKSNIDSTIDIKNNPELVSANKEIASISALWFFKNKIISRLGKIDDKTSSSSVTKIVNPKKLKEEERKEFFEKFKKEIDCDE